MTENKRSIGTTIDITATASTSGGACHMQPRYANEVGKLRKEDVETVFVINVEIEDSKFERSTGRS